MNPEYFIEASVSPHEILAGDSTEITVRLILGPDFSSEGSRIVFDMPGYFGYSRPSYFEQEVDGYTEVLCSNPDLTYKTGVWDVEAMAFTRDLNRGNSKSSAQRFFVIDFLEGQVAKGDELLIKWGYTRDGFGIGTRVTTLVLEKEFYNTIYVRYFKDGSIGLPDLGRSFKGYERPVPDTEISVKFRILPREPEKMRLIRTAKNARLSVLDRFSNICSVENIRDFINEEPEGYYNSFGVYELSSPAVHITSKTLPFYATPVTTNVFEGKNIYFGDLHVHSSASVDCIERERLDIDAEMSFEYAKNVRGLDFLAITDHHKPYEEERRKISKEHWEKLNEAVERYSKDGEFLGFAGFEFKCNRGDTVVVFNEKVKYEDINNSHLKSIENLWSYFRDKNFITIPHMHDPGSLPLSQWKCCPYKGVEPILEIYSCIGNYEDHNALERGLPEYWTSQSRWDRNGRYFIKEGYHYGFICNSDGHKGHPGSSGLTAVYAEELTKDAIFEAIRNRNVYGTTNARIRLLFTINGKLMGSVLPNAVKKDIHISVKGERNFKAVDIIKNGELYKRFKPYSSEFETDLTICCDEKSNWYVRATQVDNHIAFSSPIWFE
jgi:hypothetical protein